MANSDTETMVKKAHGMFRDGNLLLAADLCRDTLKIDANNVEALNLLAAVLTEGGLNEQALKFFQQSLLVGGPVARRPAAVCDGGGGFISRVLWCFGLERVAKLEEKLEVWTGKATWLHTDQ